MSIGPVVFYTRVQNCRNWNMAKGRKDIRRIEASPGTDQPCRMDESLPATIATAVVSSKSGLKGTAKRFMLWSERRCSQGTLDV